MDDGNLPALPGTQANFPCLQEIAGVDPYFTPPLSTDSPPLNPAAASSPLFSTTAQPAAHSLASDAKQTTSEADKANVEVFATPPVEIIGQQFEPMSVLPEKNPVTQSPQPEAEPAANLMKNSNPEHPVVEKSIVEIHEYDLAMKVLSNIETVEVTDESQTEQTGSTDSGEPLNDTMGYWGPGNVPCFTPGSSPAQAYPAGKEFVEQISVAGEMNSVSPGDIAPQPETPVAVSGEAEVDNTAGEIDVQANVTEELDPIVKSAFEPIQIDPFNNDVFESVRFVPPTRSRNQDLQTSAISEPKNDVQNDVDSTQEVELIDPLNENTTPQNVLAETDEPVVAEEMSSAATEPELNTGRFVATPLDVTQSIPQLPNTDVADQNSGPYELFESVEQSLSDLQSITESDSEESFSPATGALAETNAEEVPPTQQLYEHVEQFETLESHDYAQQVEAETPEPIQQPQHETFSPATEALAGPAAEEVLPALQPYEHVAQFETLEPQDYTQQVEAETPVPTQQPQQETFSPATEALAGSAVEEVPPTQPEGMEEQGPQVDSQSETESELESQVIQVDGRDGYDFIDLKAFDVKDAMFSPGKIFLNTEKASFRIEYQNLNLAVFAGDFQVQLN